MGRSRVLEDPFKDSQQVSLSRYFHYLPNKLFNKFCTDGFLVLGHDVDRYSASNTIPVKQNYNIIHFFGSSRTSCTTFDWCARPSARISSSPSSPPLSPPSLFPSSPPSVPSPLSPWCPPSPSPRLLLLLLLLLQMIIGRIRPLTNDHPKDPASCKCISGGTGLLQMIIGRIPPLANDHPEEQAFCIRSLGGSGLLQMIIPRIPPLANDHPNGSASCK